MATYTLLGFVLLAYPLWAGLARSRAFAGPPAWLLFANPVYMAFCPVLGPGHGDLVGLRGLLRRDVGFLGRDDRARRLAGAAGVDEGGEPRPEESAGFQPPRSDRAGPAGPRDRRQPGALARVASHSPFSLDDPADRPRDRDDHGLLHRRRGGDVRRRRRSAARQHFQVRRSLWVHRAGDVRSAHVGRHRPDGAVRGAPARQPGRPHDDAAIDAHDRDGQVVGDVSPGTAPRIRTNDHDLRDGLWAVSPCEPPFPDKCLELTAPFRTASS